MAEIPEQMTAIVLNSYGVEGLNVEQVPVPQPGPGEVLVKIAAAPINPSDFGVIWGTSRYMRTQLPAIAGLEGSGTVVQSGGGLLGRYFMGKHVACVRSSGGGGTWAEYMVTRASNIYPLGRNVSLEQGAMSIINPLSALALLEIAKKGGHRTFINTAAASVLGQMLLRLAAKDGIQIINIVRREEQADFLKQQGAAIVLNSKDEDFADRLRELCREHKVRLALDAIAGRMTETLLDALLPGGKVIIYSVLSGKEPCISPYHFTGPDKSIEGFLLSTWASKRNFLRNLMLWRRAQKMMTADLHSHIRARISFQEVEQALADYQGRMSGGKILLVP